MSHIKGLCLRYEKMFEADIFDNDNIELPHVFFFDCEQHGRCSR
jgi:hypothetical protein